MPCKPWLLSLYWSKPAAWFRVFFYSLLLCEFIFWEADTFGAESFRLQCPSDWEAPEQGLPGKRTPLWAEVVRPPFCCLAWEPAGKQCPGGVRHNSKAAPHSWPARSCCKGGPRKHIWPPQLPAQWIGPHTLWLSFASSRFSAAFLCWPLALLVYLPDLTSSLMGLLTALFPWTPPHLNPFCPQVHSQPLVLLLWEPRGIVFLTLGSPLESWK